MTPEAGSGGSVTRWLGGLRVADEAAAAQLWRRYFDRLVRVAQARLRAGARGASDGEDVALSAFQSLCAGAARGRFPGLGDRDDLWRLLVTIARRKAAAQVRRQRRAKRGGGRVATATDLAGPDPDEAPAALDRLAGRGAPPDADALVAEQFACLLGALRDDSLRQVALLRMEGYSGEEIAERLGCNRRTVTRKLELIRRTWSEGETP